MDDKLLVPLDDFKERELEILKMMADGLSNQEIADQLFITKETVRWYNKQIYSKLGTSRRTEAIALAREMKLISDDDDKTHFNNIPITNGTFWGRQEEIAQLKEIVARPNTRLITLLAPGGMGKTRLAVELAHEIANNYVDGVYFFDLATLTDTQKLPLLMVDVFQLSPNSKSPMQPILNFCRDKNLLLLFDNFENVMSGFEYLLQILKNTENVKIIVTSRNQFDKPEETIFRVNPLKKEAENLFIEMAQRRLPDFEVTEQNKLYIKQVCELVEGLPLGIILAASWVDALSVAEIAEEIKTNLDFLEDELTDLPERQRSIRVVLRQTWQHMTSQEQQHFARLSVFRGGFNRHAVQEITGTTVQLLRSFLGKALIQRTKIGRFTIHALILEFTKEQFAEDEAAQTTIDKHIQYFHDFANEKLNAYRGSEPAPALRELQREADNITAAVDYAFEWSDVNHLAMILADTASIFLQLSLHNALIKYIDRALQFSLSVENELQLLFAKISYHTSSSVSQFVEGQTIAEQALALVNAMPEVEQTPSILKLRARIESKLGYCLTKRSQRNEARTHLTKAIDILEVADDDNRLIDSYRWMGQIEASDENYERAEYYISRALSLSHEIDSVYNLRQSYDFLCYIYKIKGEFDKAQHAGEQTLLYSQRLNHNVAIALSLANLGSNAMYFDEHDVAYNYYQRALKANEHQQDRGLIAYVSGNLGFIELRAGNLDRAHEYFLQRLEFQKDRVWAVLEILVGFAGIAYHQADYFYAAVLIDFVQNYEGVDNSRTLDSLALDFDTNLTPEQLQAAHEEASQLELDKVVKNIIEASRQGLKVV